ncbi:unnamed protein product, partial [Ectocarpus sp. 13 AM-2016]
PAARPQKTPAAPLRGGVTAAAAPACSSFLPRTGEPFRRRSSPLPPSPPPSPSGGAGLLSSQGDGALAGSIGNGVDMFAGPPPAGSFSAACSDNTEEISSVGAGAAGAVPAIAN